MICPREGRRDIPVKKQINLGILLSFIAQGIAVAVNLVYTPMLVRILGTDEYGLYQLVQSVVNYLNLMNFGFNGAYISFFAREKTKRDENAIARLNGVFLMVFMGISVLCLIAGAVLVRNIYILGNNLTQSDYATAVRLLRILVLNAALNFPNCIFTVYIAANERFVFKQSVSILINLLIPLCNLPLLLHGYGSIGIASVTLGLSVLRLMLNMFFCLGKLKMRFRFGLPDKALLENLVAFTFFIFLSDVVDQMNSNVDKFLLARILGKVPVAVYSVGFELGTYYTFCSWVIPEMFIPEANRIAVEEQDNGKLTELFTRIGRYNNYVLLLVLTGFILVGKSFIQLWVGDGYEDSYFTAVILMLAYYIPSVQTLGVNIQNAKNMHRPRSVIYFVIACANIFFSIPLIRRWGVVGTSLGTFIALFLGVGIFMNIYYHRKIGLNVFVFWKEILRWTCPAAILCCVAGLIMPHIEIDSWLRLAVFILVYSSVYMLVLYLFGLRHEERKALYSYVRAQKSKWKKGSTR